MSKRNSDGEDLELEAKIVKNYAKAIEKLKEKRQQENQQELKEKLKIKQLIKEGKLIIIDSFFTKIKNKALENKEEIIDIISQKIYQDINKGTKYELSFENTPAWDSSGQLIEKGDLELDDYESYKDFLEEYTGTKRATFISGRGWSYNLFREEYEREILEWIYKYIDLTVEELLKDNREAFINFLKEKEIIEDMEKLDLEINSENIVDEILFFDIIGDQIIDFEIDITSLLNKIDIKILYERGKENGL